MTETKSPFKFLDYYDSEDVSIFFGRKDEEKVMYQLVKKNRFVLIYGPSGSGKTSLVQCGLARQFESHEWIPVYVRRGNNINISLLNELKEKFQIRTIAGAHSNERDQLKYIVTEIRKSDLRPIYLIFDQFEELLILGTDREKEIFKGLLHEIIEQHSVLSCNVILLLQEEYFAWLDTFEKDLRGISENRLRVEPMRRDDVKEVIQKSCDHFKISIENPEADINHIIEVLSGKNFISLPYLQVYLDQLWKHAEKKQTLAPRNNGLPHLKFSSSDIRIFGNFKDVLFRFLKQRSEEIQHELSMHFRGADEDCVFNILDCFVTFEGTKLPIPYTLSNGIYTLDEKAPKYVKELKPAILKFVLEKLLESRILRADGTNLELAHDTLSKLIDSQRNSMSRRENEIRMEVQKGFEEWKKDPKEFLRYKKVKEFESLIPMMKLDKAQLDFYNRSRAFREDEELEKLKSVRKFNRLKFTISLLVILLLIGLLVGNYLLNKANTDFALVYMAYTNDTISDKTKALRLAKHIYDFKSYQEADNLSLQTKIKRIAMDQAIQSLFALYPTDTLVKKVFGKGEVDISPDGEYIFIKEDDASKIFHNGKPDTTFKQKSYGYFMNSPSVLLLAGNSETKTSSPTGMSLYANQFILYDCKARKVIENVNLDKEDGFLYYPSVLFGETERPFDSYRVKFTVDGGLMVPFLEFNQFVIPPMIPLTGKILFVDTADNFKSEPFPSEFSVSSSKKKDGFLALEKSINNKYTINAFTRDGTIVESLPDIYFADFTESGSLMYIKKGTLFFKKRNKIDSFKVQPHIAYAYADGDQSHAIATIRKDSVFVLNLSNKAVFGIKGQLIGSDFKSKKFLSKQVIKKEDRKSPADTLILREFTGKVVDSFVSPEGIESYLYNSDSGTTLLLSRKDEKTGYQYLYLLDNRLCIKSCFGLTPNDTYGMSADGQRFFYLRDNFLSVFRNDTTLRNLQDFNALHNWMDNKKEFASVDSELVKYKLIFPKQRIRRVF